MTQEELRVQLRQIEKSDLGSLRNLAVSNFSKLVNFPFAPTIAESERWLANSLKSPQENYFLITASKTNASTYTVGLTGLENIDWINRHAELFFVMYDKEKYAATIQSLPLTSLALSKILRIGFRSLGLNKIYIQVAEHNKSLGALEAAGFVVEGIRKDALFLGGQFRSGICLSLTSAEYGVANAGNNS